VIARDVQFLERNATNLTNDEDVELLQKTGADLVAESPKAPIPTVQVELTLESFPDESQGIPQQEIDDQPQEAAPLLRGRDRSKIMRTDRRGRPRKQYNTRITIGRGR